MPGANPTISSRASGAPNEGTGALNQSGSRSRNNWRKLARRGQRGQSRGGSAAVIDQISLSLFFVEIVVRAGRCAGGRWRRAALEELRCVTWVAQFAAF